MVSSRYALEFNLLLFTLLFVTLEIRERSMEYIQKFLFGDKNYERFSRTNRSHADTTTTTTFSEHLHLYEHLARCSSTLQLFLKYNTIYWAFVPMSIIDAEDHDDTYLPRGINRMKSTVSEDEIQLQMFLDDLPPVPHGYRFSKQQYEHQIQFFRREYYRRLPKVVVNLFEATMIAVCMYLSVIFITNICFTLQCHRMFLLSFDSLYRHSLSHMVKPILIRSVIWSFLTILRIIYPYFLHQSHCLVVNGVHI